VLPPSSPGGGVVVPRTLAQTPVFLSFGSKSSGFSVLVDRSGDPVDSCVSSDSLVGWAERQQSPEPLERSERGEGY
jgi:hypothetical protein